MQKKSSISKKPFQALRTVLVGVAGALAGAVLTQLIIFIVRALA